MSEELNELQEHAEHAKHDPTLAPVSLTMAVLAVLVAIVSLLGHRAHTEEVVFQGQASDTWAHYQAKNIRRHQDEIFDDLTSVQATTDAVALAKLREQYSGEVDRYKDEMKKLEDTANEFDSDVKAEMRRADRFDLAEVFLEIALVITSITLLSGRRIFWGLGLVFGVVGIITALTGYMLH